MNIFEFISLILFSSCVCRLKNSKSTFLKFEVSKVVGRGLGVFLSSNIGNCHEFGRTCYYPSVAVDRVDIVFDCILTLMEFYLIRVSISFSFVSLL